MKTNIVVLALLALLAVSCTEDQAGPTYGSGNPPGQVAVVAVDNQPAQSKITYKLPGDKDLLYVRAVYKLNSGEIREVKSSYYTNSIVVDGFGDTKIHEIKLFTVNRGENASEPVIVYVKPLENPIWDVRRSLVISDDFSGVNVRASNPGGKSVAVEIIRKDSLGIWRNVEGIETMLTTINQSKRGLDYEKQYEFGFTVRDRFLNYTDTLYATINPLYEMMLDKKKFADMKYSGDAGIAPNSGNNPMNKMWDGVKDWLNSSRWAAANKMAGEPIVNTIDLGVPVKLSRITMFNWGTGFGDGIRRMYITEHIRQFEVWGSLQLPANSASFEGWTKLGEFENFKPSGLPYGEESPEDIAIARAGFDYTFPIEYLVPVRYIRIKVNKTWGEPMTMYGIAEIDVYGDNR